MRTAKRTAGMGTHAGRSVAAVLLALTLAAILVAAAGPGAIAAGFAQASWPGIAAGLVAAALFFALRGARWSLLLRPHAKVTARDAACLEAMGWTASSLLPFKAGDALRAGWLRRRTHPPVGFAAAAGTIAVERVLDLAGLALAATFGLGALALLGPTHLPGWLAAALAVAWILPGAAAACFILAAVRVRRQARRGRLMSILHEGLIALPALARRPRRLAAVLTLSLGVTAAQLAIQTLLVWALVPDAPVLAVLAAAPIFTLTFALPLAPGHVGTYEAGFAAAFGLAGLPAATLLPTAVAAHAVALGIALAAGTVAWLLLPKATTKAAVPQATPEEAPA